jgi:hypothetical protein
MFYPKYEILWKSLRWDFRFSKRIEDVRTWQKLTIAFVNYFMDASKKESSKMETCGDLL